MKKQGISLIVLVITIIVMIILASAIILSLNNTNIFDKADEAVDASDLNTVEQLAALAWSEAFLNGKATQVELEDAVMDALEANDVDTSKYIVIVSTKGVGVTAPTESIVKVVDNVPIPKGFVASPYDGENTKNGGLVIYELEAEEDEIAILQDTHYEALTERNQYVWVPVPDFTQFVRKTFTEEYALSDVVGENYWELALNKLTNMPVSIENDLLPQDTIIEAQAMYASVKKYGGFYVARYEAGVEEKRTNTPNTSELTVEQVSFMMNKKPATMVLFSTNSSVTSGSAIAISRGIYPSDGEKGVVSTLIYGVQWDAVMQWYKDTSTVTNFADSTPYGNYTSHEIAAGDLNTGAMYATYNGNNSTGYLTEYTPTSSNSTKDDSTSWILTTGALKAAKLNNIYDMAGNVYEATMEKNIDIHTIIRGGVFNAAYKDNDNPCRIDRRTRSNGTSYSAGFRTALYIK